MFFFFTMYVQYVNSIWLGARLSYVFSNLYFFNNSVEVLLSLPLTIFKRYINVELSLLIFRANWRYPFASSNIFLPPTLCIQTPCFECEVVVAHFLGQLVILYGIHSYRPTYSIKFSIQSLVQAGKIREDQKRLHVAQFFFFNIP